MTYINAVSTIDFPYQTEQQEVKHHVREMFSAAYPMVEQALDIFENAEINKRNFCKPLTYYKSQKDFNSQNATYIECSVVYAAQAIRECAVRAGVGLNEITDIIFVSSTGLATPSIDALLVNQLKLNRDIRRYPLWGLGCGGGVSGIAKAAMITEAKPEAVVLLVAVELCSLTFLKSDFSKSNFVATSLFSDGIAAVIIRAKQDNSQLKFRIIASDSRLYYNTTDIMGWEFLNSGFKVVFSRDIPAFINQFVRPEVDDFLAQHDLKIEDIRHFIFHPGGKKVIDAYKQALDLDEDSLRQTSGVIRDYGNMSSPTVLYVLERFMNGNCEKGYGLMLALGPGFCTEMVLLSVE